MTEKTLRELIEISAFLLEASESITLIEVALGKLEQMEETKELKSVKNLLKVFLTLRGV